MVSGDLHPLVKQKSVGGSEFLGSFGGLMGLVAGMSLLSIIELILLTLTFTFRVLKNHKNRNKVWAFKSPATRPKEFFLNKKATFENFSDFIVKFLTKSSIHGLQKIADKNRNLCEKGFWISVALASAIFSLVMIYDVTESSELNPIEFAIDEKIWNLNDVRLTYIFFNFTSEKSRSHFLQLLFVLT